ncbi:Malonyl-coenzyme A:anthocyanin 3-O-glucoside-6''-O-malonyltransferase [Dendrobium catenatum]|uniref:Malonyl-coenzyme A:anthocyanin 3-O-glucoside-6''-O-malonyltransferase n=2 Tax=Dendrobium catenatum TaxID=906689 RepID=A0A2I0XEW4_9ASPA|nr:Malonyl-coenzyme A:anthocyanin 3-O-glucoside-6''-O-malonyltransferase [Dendrobium catenatum]
MIGKSQLATTSWLHKCERHDCIAGEQPFISFLDQPTIRHLSPFTSKPSSAMAALRVLHEIQISPCPSLPSQPPQRLSFLDALWLLSSQPVERLFFYEYPHPTSHFIDHNLPIFTKSLSLTLHRFYPLAGSIRPSPDSDDHFEIAYEEGDSVTITVAEFIGEDFRNISGHHPRNFKNIRLLVPKLSKSSTSGQLPPISIQITIFPTQGICISFAIKHAACDGSGSTQFIRSLTAACWSSGPTLDNISPPFLDRSIIVDTHGIQRIISEKILQYKGVMKQDSLPTSDPSLVSATFTLFKDQILRLKERVKASGAEEGKPSFHLSAFVVTCAYVWRCLVKARAYNKDIQQCYFSCAVDWRSRMRPPIPRNYFGNCLGACMAELNVTELVGKNGIEVAAMEIGKSIDELQGRDVGEVLEAMIIKYLEVARSRTLSVAGSPKLRVYETDFGWGKPVKVDITSIFETGAISLAESREEDGGIEIGLVLSEEEMNKFGMNFATDLLDLQD